MIDKLDLRVPGAAPFTESFGRLYAGMRADPKRWRQSKHYAASASFEDCGMDILLHVNCTMTKNPMHKLEIIRTGEKTYEEMVTLAARVFDSDPEDFGIMRIDLTADVEGVPVDWFKRHTLVRSKQTRREMGSVEPYMTIGKGRAETLYSGVKPNQIRIYDKTAERRMQYQKYVGKFAREVAGLPDSFEIEPTTFEAMYGHDMNEIVTRVERQVSARDVEKLGLSEMRSIRMRADSISPFEKMVFFDDQALDPRIEDYSFDVWNAGMNLQSRVREFGIAETHRWMRMQLGSNFNRAKKKYASFFRLSDNVVGIDSARLKNIYQASSYRQILRAA
jgi:hypothetical protein